MLQTIRPLLTVTAATLGSLAFTSLIDCQPSLYLWDQWHSKRAVSDSYKDKNVWIIGASSGIGEELAYQLACSGCSNLILSSRNANELEKVATKCNKAAPSCQCFCRPLDVLCGDGEDVEALEARFEDLIENQLPPFPLDLIIFNAGAGQLRPAMDTSAKAIEKIMNVNSLWPMILTPLLFKYDVFQSSSSGNAQKAPQQQPATTRRKRRAHIMVTNSIAAQLPVPLSSVYAASKAAQAHYFASMAAEQPDNSLRVDMICPGPVETQFHQNHLQIQSDKDASTVGTTTTNDAKQPKSKTKMSVERCVHLMLAAMARKDKGTYREAWIAPSPLISVLYLQRFFPGLFQKLTTRFGQKRVQLWKEGKDLYDPKSWK